ncbi:MAG: tyrosine-type recombinase/integrase [Candidatus Kuenenia sp.]|nr:tyrosine-type recombinase/integrase [Candidatus Kuenenia hertensis]
MTRNNRTKKGRNPYGLKLRGSVWNYDFHVRKRRYRGTTHTHDYELAKLYAAKKYKESYLDQTDIQKLTHEVNVSDFIKRHILALQAEYSSHWTYSSELTLNEFSEFLKSQGVDVLSKISVEVLESFKIEQLNRVKKITVKNKFKIIKAFLNRAIKYGYLTKNPARQIVINGIHQNKTRFFSKEEIEKIFTALDLQEHKRFAYMKNFLMVALYTGMRRGELTHLCIEDADLERKVICVRNKNGFSTKSRKERVIPIHDKLVPVFKGIKKERQQGYCFLHLGKKYNDKTATKNFVILCERSGIENAGIHTLRHTFASYLIMAGVSMRMVAEYLGHSTARVTELYSHVSEEKKNGEIQRLGF